MKKYILLILIIGIIFVSGCTESSNNIKIAKTFESNNLSIEEQATQACIKECENRLNSGMNLDDGPCLSDDDITWMIEDWVCDIAHEPRESIDNLPENQCQAFRSGEAHHFIELDPNCKFIRAI